MCLDVCLNRAVDHHPKHTTTTTAPFQQKPTLIDPAPVALLCHQSLGTGFSSLQRSHPLLFTIHMESTSFFMSMPTLSAMPMCHLTLVYTVSTNQSSLSLSLWALIPLPGSVQSPGGRSLSLSMSRADSAQETKERGDVRGGGLKQRNAGGLEEGGLSKHYTLHRELIHTSFHSVSAHALCFTHAHKRRQVCQCCYLSQNDSLAKRHKYGKPHDLTEQPACWITNECETTTLNYPLVITSILHAQHTCDVTHLAMLHSYTVTCL